MRDDCSNACDVREAARRSAGLKETCTTPPKCSCSDVAAAHAEFHCYVNATATWAFASDASALNMAEEQTNVQQK